MIYAIVIVMIVVALILYNKRTIDPNRIYSRRSTVEDDILCCEQYLIEAQSIGDATEEQLNRDRMIALHERLEHERLIRILIMTDTTAHNRYGVRR